MRADTVREKLHNIEISRPPLRHRLPRLWKRQQSAPSRPRGLNSDLIGKGSIKTMVGSKSVVLGNASGENALDVAGTGKLCSNTIKQVTSTPDHSDRNQGKATTGEDGNAGSCTTPNQEHCKDQCRQTAPKPKDVCRKKAKLKKAMRQGVQLSLVGMEATGNTLTLGLREPSGKANIHLDHPMKPDERGYNEEELRQILREFPGWEEDNLCLNSFNEKVYPLTVKVLLDLLTPGKFVDCCIAIQM
eukprot:g18687.t1